LLSQSSSMAKARDGASESSVVIRFQQRLAEANNFQKALITSLLAWVALGVWSYLVVVPILSAVAFLWLGVTGWLVWRIWRKPPA
jgi:1,4-dihydroxy-2-naphthoate octaprenyltransferase